MLLASLLSLVSFLLVALLKSSFTTVDAKVNLWATSIQTSSFTAIAKIVAYIFDTTALLAISLLIAVYLFYKNYRINSVLLLGAMGGDAAIVAITKTLVHSARPLNGLMHDAGSSFPSGHTAGSIVLCGLLTYFGWQYWKSPKAKALSGALFVATTFVVGFDRVYLNVHWFSDVLGGCLLGIFWLTFFILTFQLWLLRSVPVDKVFVEQPSPEAKVRLMLLMCEPMKTERFKKMWKINLSRKVHH